MSVVLFQPSVLSFHLSLLNLKGKSTNPALWEGWYFPFSLREGLGLLKGVIPLGLLKSWSLKGVWGAEK
jgi:hypothetical protein